MRLVGTLVIILLSASSLKSQINAKMMKHMDVSATHITFVYGGDIWIVPKDGGQAVQVTNSPGEESFPKFSPDGSEIAYTALYNGNLDVYVMPATGGIPIRVTYASFPDRMIDWHPDGKRILFASRRETGIPRVNQFYLVDKSGGNPEKLPVPYGELASFSPDGKELVYITKITEDYPFKRYRGGLTSEVILFNLKEKKAVNITNNEANDGKPVWAGNKIYFLSDRGSNMRLNIWYYDLKLRQTGQITHFSDFDISFLSAGPDDLVFEAGGELYLMDLGTEKFKPVDVYVVSDLSVEIPRIRNVGRNIQNATASPGGKRLVFEARGELFNVPVKEGFVLNMTNSSGAFDQQPSWSPDGKFIAYWSDQSGEYELYLQDPQKKDPAKKLTSRNRGFGYRIHWSPDSKMIAFIDEKNDISVIDITSGEIKIADNYSWNIGHGSRYAYSMNWSHDSRWLAYTKGQDNANDAIFLYDVTENKIHRITSGFYLDYNPVFSKDGKYLFYLTDREFNPVYSGLNDGTWIYPNNTQLAAINLLMDSPYLLSPKNDDLEESKEDKKEDQKDPDDKEKNKKENDKESNKGKETASAVKIDLDDPESRLTILPPKAGNLRNLMAFEGKIVYFRAPVTGDPDGKSALMYYDLEKREEKKIIDNIEFAAPAADGKTILVKCGGKYGIIRPESGQKIEDPVPTDQLVMNLNPKEEWRQIFHDTWRRFRDFFYDEDMQRVDWPALRERYGVMIEDARTRWDVSTIQSNMVSELSAGHTYTFGGETEIVQNIQNGYLGIDWTLKDNKYQIGRIIRPASWDTEVRSPLDHPGIDAEPGDYILSVNGIELDPSKEPYAAFEGLSGKTVSLAVSRTGNAGDAKNLIIKCLTQGQEQILRYLEWIDGNRKLVDELSGGQLGYVYMSNTSSRGQLELVSMFYGQLHKKGFVIDERFNGGGQLADRFLELMKRPVVYNLYWRHGRHHTWPIKANTGPFGMLINGWAGSGGDALPWAFKELDAGPIVGERTVGILVGPATGHMLIDGGGITVPGARLYANDGNWFWEGEGVKPDFPVWDDPNLLVKGRDPQMEKVVEEVMKLLKQKTPMATPPPQREDRTAGGLLLGLPQPAESGQE
jgi:tricorn protease